MCVKYQSCYLISILMFLAINLNAQFKEDVTHVAQWNDIFIETAALKKSCLPVLQKKFQSPPVSDYPAVYWAWNGEMDEAEMSRQIADMKQVGYSAVMIFGYKGLPFEYLGPKWFDKVRYAAKLCREQGLKLWVFDDGSFPSGFANGKVTDQHPEFRNKQISQIATIVLHKGIPLDYASDEEVVAVIARRIDVDEYETIDITDRFIEGKLSWPAQNHSYEVSVYAMQTANNKAYNIYTGGSQPGHSFEADYLNRDATKLFIETTYDRYAKELADFIPETLVGFMTDESDVTKWAWTKNYFSEFEKIKGYSIRPYLPVLFGAAKHDCSWQINFDYRDVWSRLFCSNFHVPIMDKCREMGVKSIFQPDQDHEDFNAVNKATGDLFAVNRIHSMPSSDVIWRQIWPGSKTDFPKVAASVAHLKGVTDVLSEEMAAYGFGTTVAQLKWITDYQLVRGINRFAMHLYSYSYNDWKPYHIPPDFSPANVPLRVNLRRFNDYAARMNELYQNTKPLAKVALFYPRESSQATNTPEVFQKAHEVARLLLEKQIDFEWIDSDALIHSTIKDKKLVAPSGMVFDAVIVSEQPYFPEKAWSVLLELSQSGGKVLVGHNWPVLFTEKGMVSKERICQLHTGGMNLIDSPAQLIKKAESCISSLVGVTPEIPGLRIMVRENTEEKYRVYFLFNEGEERAAGEIELEDIGTLGRIEEWNPADGKVYSVSFRQMDGEPIIPLNLYPGTTKIFIVAEGHTALPSRRAVSESEEFILNGSWNIRFGKEQMPVLTDRLSDWKDLGYGDFSGTVRYEIDFDLPLQWERHPVMLDLGVVQYAAEVWINGNWIASLPWSPFACDVSKAVRLGKNTLTVEITNTQANQFMNQAAIKNAEKSGVLKGTYIKNYQTLDEEMFPSGLKGPVRLVKIENYEEKRVF